MVAFFIAKILIENGDYPVLMSPKDGPLRNKFTDLGVPIIIDPLILTRHDSFKKFAKNFDLIIANTVVCWPIVYQFLDDSVPVVWYLHETEHLKYLAENDPMVSETLQRAKFIFVGSKKCESYCKKFRSQEIGILEYGTEDMQYFLNHVQGKKMERGPIKFIVLGTIEPRKGQDIFLEALRLIGDELRGYAEFKLVGGVNDLAYEKQLQKIALEIKCIDIFGELSYEQYVQTLIDSDVIVCPSRDDTLPLVTLDALSLNKVIVCSTGVGTSDYIKHGENGFVFKNESVNELSEIIISILKNPEVLKNINGRELYEKEFSSKLFTKKILEIFNSKLSF